MAEESYASMVMPHVPVSMLQSVLSCSPIAIAPQVVLSERSQETTSRFQIFFESGRRTVD